MRSYPLNTCLLVGLALILTGCAATSDITKDTRLLLNDEGFPSYQSYQLDTEQDVFQLSQDAKLFVDKIVYRAGAEPKDQIRELVWAIFDKSHFNLTYSGTANTTATETFESQTANCLSLTIMTWAMARYAGFDARFQEIQIPEYWTRREGFSLLNGHVNLRLFPRNDLTNLYLYADGFEVDFDPSETRKHFPSRQVSKRQIMAMYYNNKGADAMINGEYDYAYALFRQAVILDDMFDGAWVNLGLLYRLSQQYQLAEDTYRHAIFLDKENLTAWENLSYLYLVTERKTESDDILAMIHKRRQDNPFYHFILGEEAYEKDQWEKAIAHYRRALRLDNSKHQFYFGLAKSYYQLGDVSRSQRYLEEAIKHASKPEEIKRYQEKQALLSQRN